MFIKPAERKGSQCNLFFCCISPSLNIALSLLWDLCWTGSGSCGRMVVMGRSHLYREYKLAKSINGIGDYVCVYGENYSIKVLSTG